jgi:hypothetical protein
LSYWRVEITNRKKKNVGQYLPLFLQPRASLVGCLVFTENFSRQNKISRAICGEFAVCVIGCVSVQGELTPQWQNLLDVDRAEKQL